MKADEIKILTDVSHVLKLPDMYVGQVTNIKQKRWVIENGRLVEKEVESIPALLKLFDEVISNAVDEAIKTKFKFSNIIKVTIQDGFIEVSDNGRGLPIRINRTHKEFEAVLAFRKLRAGSNFDKTKNMSLIGKFGVGVALTNIFSKKFTVKTWDDSGKSLKMMFTNNNSKYGTMVGSNINNKRGTVVKWLFDYEYFGVRGLGANLGLIEKRIYDLAMIFPEITFKLNGRKIKSTKFKDYVELISKDYLIYDDKFKLAILPYDDFSQISFVNGIETVRGGSHVDFLANKICSGLKELIKKKHRIDIRPGNIKSKLLLVLSSRDIKNPKFDGQTKERLVNTQAEIKSNYNDFPEIMIKKIFSKSEIIDPIVDTYLIKKQVADKKEIVKKSKKMLKKKIPKLIDATNSKREKCILFITEGDSAAGQMIRIRDVKNHAVLPLRGKLLNVSGVSNQKVLENKVIKDIMVAIGLKLLEPPFRLRYGKIVILTDADEDGVSITALLLNFFHQYWPGLFDKHMIRYYKSPIIIAKKGKETKRFYDLETYYAQQKSLKSWSISYNKGLGGLDEEEYKLMINEPVEEVFIRDEKSAEFLKIAFGCDIIKRKEWLST